MQHKLIIPVLAAALLGGCAPRGPEAYTASMTHSAVAHSNSARLTPEIERAVAQVRAATARFQDLEVARAEGWSKQYPEGCIESPEGTGAQAYHYLNPDLVDGSVDLLRPELLMYEPQEDGSRVLVGVDYVIPFDQLDTDEPPTLLGQPFARNEPLGVWALHIWAQRANAEGTFAPWNPAVSCVYAR